MIVLTVQGSPVAQPRPVVTSTGHAYTPDNGVKAWKQLIIVHAKSAGIQQLSGPVSMDIRFTVKRPKSHFGTGRNAGTLKHSAPARHIVKPDLDNLVKAVMDALTKAGVWKDDSQVFECNASKVLCDSEHDQGVSVTIMEA